MLRQWSSHRIRSLVLYPGNLAHYLKLAGMEVCYDVKDKDHEFIALTVMREKRIVLTRDAGLSKPLNFKTVIE